MNPVVTVTGFWDAFITKIAVFLPNLFFAIAIILLGWVICNVIKRIVVRVLKLCQFDILAERAGIKQILDRGGIRQIGIGYRRSVGVLVSLSHRHRDNLGNAQFERRHRYPAHDLFIHSQDRCRPGDADPRPLLRQLPRVGDADFLRQRGLGSRPDPSAARLTSGPRYLSLPGSSRFSISPRRSSSGRLFWSLARLVWRSLWPSAWAAETSPDASWKDG